MANGASKREIESFLDGAAEAGCVSYSAVDALAQSLELEEEELAALYEAIEARGAELSDDCGHEAAAAYANGSLATATGDALDLFLNEVGRYPLLTAAEEVELAKRIETGD